MCHIASTRRHMILLGGVIHPCLSLILLVILQLAVTSRNCNLSTERKTDPLVPGQYDWNVVPLCVTSGCICIWGTCLHSNTVGWENFTVSTKLGLIETCWIGRLLRLRMIMYIWVINTMYYLIEKKSVISSGN